MIEQSLPIDYQYKRNEQKIEERKTVNSCGTKIIEIAKERLGDTAFTQEKEFTQQDLTQIQDLMIEIAPYAHRNLDPSFWNHLLLTSIYQQKIGEKLGFSDDQIMKMRCMAFLHDGGRLAITQYFTNDVACKIGFKGVGIRKELEGCFFSIEDFLKGKITGLQDLSEMQQVFDFSDNMAKFGKNGLLTKEELIEKARNQAKVYNLTEKEEKELRATERFAKKELVAHDKQSLAIQIFTEEADCLEKKGIQLDELRAEVLEEFNSDKNQEWLLDVKNSQETLDPKVDEILKRKSVTTVVFDAGGVLFNDADPSLIANLAKSFNTTENKILEAFQSLNNNSFNGKHSERKYLKEFYKQFGKTLPHSSVKDARAPFVQPEIYSAMDGMQKLIEDLDKNGVQIFILSDAIKPLAGIAKKKLMELYPQLKKENILISSEIKASKRDPNGPAFLTLKEVLKRYGIEPSEAVFIDDNFKYPACARRYGYHALTFRKGNDQTSQERMREELSKVFPTLGR